LRAPASTVFQKTWVVPLGMTAIFLPLPPPPPPLGCVVEDEPEDDYDVERSSQAQSMQTAAHRSRADAIRRFMGLSSCKGLQSGKIQGFAVS